MRFHKLPLVMLSCAVIAACSAETPTPTEEPALELTLSRTSHLLETTSAHSFDETVAKLRTGIEERPVTLFAEIDHAKGAANADLELAPSTLFIFGNPKGGTPLMTQEPRMGIALPLKIHVFEANGQVIVAHEDMAMLAGRYGLDPEAQPVPNIIALLDGLTKAATQ